MEHSGLNTDAAHEKRREKKSIALLILGVCCLAFFTSHASMSLDPPNRLKVTESIVNHGDIQVRLDAEEEKGAMGQAMVTGPDGGRYLGYHGIGQSLIFIPSYYLFHHVMGIESDKLLRSAISVTLFPLGLGLTTWVFFLLLRQFNFSPRHSFIGALLVVFATGLWEYARECQDECHIAFFFIVAAYGLRRYEKTAGLGSLALSALAISFAFITRSDTGPTVLCYLIFAAWLIHSRHRHDNQDRTVLQILLPYIVVVALTLPALFIEIIHNMHRFGHPIASYHVEDIMPYEMSGWALLLRGLKGFLYSPGKGLFFYNPILLLAIPGIFVLWRSHRRWAIYILAGFIGCLFLHAIFPSFHGNICWGPRYISRYLPLLLLLAMFFVFSLPKPSKLKLSTFSVIAIVSILVQIAAVSLHYSREHYELDMAYEGGWSDRLWTMFEPEAHFIERRIENLAAGVSDMVNDRIEPWPTQASYEMTQEQHLKAPNLNYLAFWPFHLTYYLPAVKPEWALPLWASTLIFLSGILLSLAILTWAWISCPHLPSKTSRIRPLSPAIFQDTWPDSQPKHPTNQHEPVSISSDS